MDHYTTQDELIFLNRIFVFDRPAFFRYSEVVLTGGRRWDKSINVEVVESKIRELQLTAEKERKKVAA
jgi:hypothetical protein